MQFCLNLYLMVEYYYHLTEKYIFIDLVGGGHIKNVLVDFLGNYNYVISNKII